MIAKKGAFVVVADGGGATIYRVSTRVGGVKLDDIEIIENDVPSSTARMGRDRPGRTNDAAGRQSAMETRDLHDDAEAAFAADIAGRVNRIAQTAKRGVIIVAPPRFLGALRPHLSDGAKAALAAEIAKDMRKLGVSELEHAVDRLDGDPAS